MSGNVVVDGAVPEEPLPEERLLELRGVGRRFGGLLALDGVDLAVRAGSITGLIGPNGAGKTTLFNLVTGLTRPTAGTIHFAGREVGGTPPHRITRLGIARTFQNIRLFPSLSVLQNVRVAQNLHAGSGVLGLVPFYNRAGERDLANQARTLLEEVGLWELRDSPATSLAYADQRRLEIARALASGPRLLLLDEPAAGMSTAERAELVGELRRLHERGVTLLLVEHDTTLVLGVCDDVYVLNFGKVIAHGPPDTVRRDEAVVEAYLGRDDASDLEG